MAISFSILSALNAQKASKDELMCIKGIGEKKAAAVLKYRQKNKITSAQDLLNIKGFGKALVKNVEKDIKSVACGGKKTTKKKKTTNSTTKSQTKTTESKKAESTKTESKASDSKTNDSKKESTDK